MLTELDGNEKQQGSDWINYYHQNPMSPEFIHYTEYYIKALKDHKKVLVIEDDEFSFKIIESFIKDYDAEMKCFFASNEKDAEDIMRTFHCDLIIADYFLDEQETGLAICNEIKKKYPGVECLIISSLKHHQYQEILKYSPIELQFLEKPLSKKKVISFLNQVYGGGYG